MILLGIGVLVCCLLAMALLTGSAGKINGWWLLAALAVLIFFLSSIKENKELWTAQAEQAGGIVVQKTVAAGAFLREAGEATVWLFRAFWRGIRGG